MGLLDFYDKIFALNQNSPVALFLNFCGDVGGYLEHFGGGPGPGQFIFDFGPFRRVWWAPKVWIKKSSTYKEFLKQRIYLILALLYSVSTTQICLQIFSQIIVQILLPIFVWICLQI